MKRSSPFGAEERHCSLICLGKPTEVGRKWLASFLRRWQSELKVLKEQKLETARRNGFTEEVRRGWFSKVHHILTNNQLIEWPHSIFNCDESGFSDETSCKEKSMLMAWLNSTSEFSLSFKVN
jgi:hypothetical protein